MAVKKEGNYSVYSFEEGVLKDIFSGTWRYSCVLAYEYDAVKYNDLTYDMAMSDYRIKVPISFKNGEEWLVIENLTNGSKSISLPNLTLEGNVKEEFHKQFGEQSLPKIEGIFTDDGTPCGFGSYEEQCFYFFPNHYRFNESTDTTPSENGMYTKDRPCMLTITNGESTQTDLNFTLKNVGFTTKTDKAEMVSCDVYVGGKEVSYIPSSSMPIVAYIYPVVKAFWAIEWNDGYIEDESEVDDDVVSVLLYVKGGVTLGAATKNGDAWEISIPSTDEDITIVIEATTERGHTVSTMIEQYAELQDEYEYKYVLNGFTEPLSYANAISGNRIAESKVWFDRDVYVNGVYDSTDTKWGYATVTHSFDKNVSTSQVTVTENKALYYMGKSYSANVTFVQDAARVSYNYSIYNLALSLATDYNGDYVIDWRGGSCSASCDCTYVATWSDSGSEVEYTYGTAVPSYSVSIGLSSGSTINIPKNAAGDPERGITVTASKGNASESVFITQSAQTSTTTYGTFIYYNITGDTSFSYFGGSFAIDVTDCGYSVDRKYEDGIIIKGTPISTSISCVSCSAFDGASVSGSNGAYTVSIPQINTVSGKSYNIILDYSYGDVRGSERIVVTQSGR